MARIYKCNICKEEIDTETNDKKSFFFELDGNKKKCFHCDCFINYKTTRSRKKMTLNECSLYIASCKKNYETYEKKQSSRNMLFDYIIDMYELTFVPKHFYIKFSEVFNGTYKGLNKKVPPDDLLDMWKQKRNFLLKNAENQRKRGNEITGIARVWYDLAILLGRYDAYLAWKEQQKNALVELEEKKKEQVEFIEYKDISKNIGAKEKDGIDIYSMLDEI